MSTVRETIKNYQTRIEELLAENESLRAENAMWQENPAQPSVPKSQHSSVLKELARVRTENRDLKHKPDSLTVQALISDNKEQLETIERLRKRLKDAGLDHTT